jgi:hypothetical protein
VGIKKLGAILVENGFISPKDLFNGLKAQVKGIIYNIFLWDDADYRFEGRLPADIIKLQIHLQDLIMEIIHRMKRRHKEGAFLQQFPTTHSRKCFSAITLRSPLFCCPFFSLQV